MLTPSVVRGPSRSSRPQDEEQHRHDGGVVYGESALQLVEGGLGMLAAEQVVDDWPRDREACDGDEDD